MHYPDKQQFIELSKKGNVIPVHSEAFADFDTPLSAFLKIDEGEFSYLLESVEEAERLGRYSFMGSNPSMVIESKKDKITIRKGNSVDTYVTKTDPMEEIKTIMDGFKFVGTKGLPRFCGGLVGYMGYDMVRFFEDIPDNNPEELDMPDMQFVLTDTILMFDHVDHKIKVVSNAMIDGDPAALYDEACAKIDRIIKKLKKPTTAPKQKKSGTETFEIESNFTEEGFSKIVEAAKEHIRAGDIIQVVLSQRLKRKTRADAFSIYRALRSVNPSPYMFYLKFGRYRIVGSSPEILVRCEDEVVEVRPIAGTRKRGKDAAEDMLLEKELLADPKERAEHIMLLDLGRNDIGRVCDYSTVKPREVMRVEKYSHVMHIVSDVVGKLRDDKNIFDLIRATFPAGTVTGAPKVKAMELVDKFENTRRGPYAGCAGYIGFSGNIDLCITIRTIVFSGDTAHIQAGAGIVLDSEPEKEYHETLNKAMALIRAIEFAEKGLK
ncbi:MAG: anthranilate synthase component I [Candidatus Omnitrophica bacterium]|nr:anthranilate synthase component I [Candidatus Omnitrophota bacterium]